MRLSKEVIRGSFSRAARTYDGSSDLQKEIAGELAERFSRVLAGRDAALVSAIEMAETGQTPPGRAFGAPLILDIGCGTGNLGIVLKALRPGSSVIGSDIALPMLAKAREAVGGRLAASDCEALPFRDSAFDSVLSSLAYQWAVDIHTAFKEAKRVLKPGGLFYLATLGPGTLTELRTCLKGASEFMEFLSTGEISGALSSAGLEVIYVERREAVKRYDRLLHLLRVLKNIGAAPRISCNSGLSAPAPIKKAGEEYAERFPSPEGGIMATYEVIFAAARRG